VRKASHFGSKQQQRSCTAITLCVHWSLCWIVHTLVSAELPHRNHSIIACSRHIYILLFFAHILFMVNHTINTTQRRSCNNIPSFLQWTAPIAHSFLWRLHTARPPHPGHSTIWLRSEILSGMCAKLRTVAASNNRDHAPQSLFAYASRYVTQSTQRQCRGCNTSNSGSKFMA